MSTRRTRAVGASQTLRPRRTRAAAAAAAATSAPAASAAEISKNNTGAAAIAADIQAMEDFFNELDHSVEESIQMMELNAGTVTDAIRNSLNVAFFSIPTTIRNMNAQEFVNQYGGDLSVFVEHDRREAVAKTHSAEAAKQKNFLATARVTALAGGPGGSRTRSRLKDNGGGGTVRRGAMLRAATLATPAPGGNGFVPATPAMDPNLPQTPAQVGGTVRRPRRGETLMSARGSPVVVLGGDDLEGSGQCELDGARAPSILTGRSFQGLASMLGGEMELPSDMSSLKDEEKHVAFQQLTAMSDQINALLSQIN
jgi:hypothetical protein